MADEPKPTEAPAEGPETPAEGVEGAVTPDKKKKMLMLAGAGVAVLGIVGGGAVFFLMGHSDEKVEETPTEIPVVAIYDVPEINANLLSEDPTSQHFMKAKMAIELANGKDTENVGKLLPKLQDDWLGFLRQMRVADLQGSANLQRLKEGLLRRANQSLDPVAVKAVYIRELLVQ